MLESGFTGRPVHKGFTDIAVAHKAVERVHRYGGYSSEITTLFTLILFSGLELV